MTSTQAADPVHHGEAARWHWAEPRHHEHFRRCSYCGCVHPDDLAAEPVWRAEWADWKYGWPHKFYVHMPNREPDRLFYTGSVSRWSEEYRARGYIPTEELTDEQRAILRGDISHDPEPDQGWMLGTRDNHFGKFYTAHLADPAISDETKDVIQRRSGLRLTFAGGRVFWEQWSQPSQDDVAPR
jgi:hypothetical protein